jgi:hypothetical protein
MDAVGGKEERNTAGESIIWLAARLVGSCAGLGAQGCVLVSCTDGRRPKGKRQALRPRHCPRIIINGSGLQPLIEPLDSTIHE